MLAQNHILWNNQIMGSSIKNGFPNFDLENRPVMIVGIVKDIQKSIHKDLANLSRAFNMFKEIHWYLVESGSTDQSTQVLAKIKSENKYFDFETLSNTHESRTEVMAQARNAYLVYLRNKFDLKEFPYVVVADFNLLNNKITTEAVYSSWDRNDWDVVTANQSGKYYDIWALRHDLWSPNDCWKHHSFLREYFKFPELAITYAIRARMIKIPKNSKWIQVKSAFGGLAIYKTELFMKPFFYQGYDSNGNTICEHVPFHEKLYEAGAKIFINPKLINTRNTDHTKRIKFFYTFVRMLGYSKIYNKNKSLWTKS
jgi:hypothetical protein